jgi:MFS superfamily sulfate permease-like transporter
VRWLVIDGSAITGIDYSAGRALAELHQDLAKKSVVLALSRVHPLARGGLERPGLIKLIGPDRIFSSRRQCVAAYQAWAADISRLAR